VCNRGEPNPTVTTFRIIPCAVFLCIECGERLKVGKSLPDLLSTGITCLRCDAVYKVTWGKTDAETRIEMTLGRI